MFEGRDREEVGILAELLVLLLTGVVGALCGFCNTFPKIVVNCWKASLGGVLPGIFAAEGDARCLG